MQRSWKPLLSKGGLLSQSPQPSYACLRRKFCNKSSSSSSSCSSSSSIFNSIEGIRGENLHLWNNNGGINRSINKRSNSSRRYNGSRSLQVSWFSSSSSQPSKGNSDDVATAGATAAEIEINRLTKTKELLKEQQTLLHEQIKLSAEKEMLLQEQISLLEPPAAAGASSGSDESSRKSEIEKKLADIEKKVPENIWALQKIKRKLDSNKAALEASDPKSTTTTAAPEDAVVTNQRENIELFKQFSPFKMAKLVLKSAIYPSQRAEVSKLLDLDLFSGTNSARLTYVMLQHPIIKKYGFDYENFMEGAREYIPIIIGNIDSKEFLDFCLTGKENESSQYLSSICDPVVFYHLKEMVKDRHKTVRITNTEISDLALMGISPYQSLNRRRKEKPSKEKTVNNNGDVSTVVDNVSSATNVVSNVTSSDSTGSNSNSNSNSSSNSNSNSNNNNSNTNDSKNQNSNTTSDNNFVLDIRQLVTKSKQQDPFGTAWTNQFYPNLSSVLRVTVQFELRRYFKHVDNSNGELGSTDNKGNGNIFSKLSDDVKLQEEKTGDTMTAFLAFDACLSGERPYEWKLRHMNI